MVRDRAPAGRGDVGLIRGRNTERHRDIADHAEHAGQRRHRVFALGNGLHIEGGAGEAIGRAVGARQHGCSANILPIGVKRQLLVEDRRIGHHRILRAVMDHQLALDIFEDGAVTRCVRDCEVERAEPFLAGNIVGNDDEAFLAQCVDRLLHRGEIVEHILGPDGDAHARLLAIEMRIFGFDQPQEIGGQPRLVHAVRGGNVVAGGDHAAIARRPFDRIGASLPTARDAARKDPEVGADIDLPVHRPGGDHIVIGAMIDQARAGIGRYRSQLRREQRKTGQESRQTRHGTSYKGHDTVTENADFLNSCHG